MGFGKRAMGKQALFVMAKDPRAGHVKTRLCPPLSPEMAARLYRCFLLDVLDLVAAVPGVDPVVAYTPPESRAAFARRSPRARLYSFVPRSSA